MVLFEISRILLCFSQKWTLEETNGLQHIFILLKMYKTINL